MRRAWLVGLAIAAGCGSEAKSPAPPPRPAAAPVAIDPAAEHNALWALAPTDARIGLVGTARGLAMVERAWHAFRELIGASVDLAQINNDLMHGLLTTVGTPDPTLAEFGLSHDHGFAVFVVGATSAVLVVPLGDRAKFVERLHGTRGPDGDIVGPFVCKPLAARYVCAERRDLFAQIGHGGLDAVRKSVAAHGDLELAVRRPDKPDAPTAAAIAELAPGVVTVRGTIAGLHRPLDDVIGAPLRARPGSATSAGFGVADLRPYLAKLPPRTLAGGVTIEQLGQSIAGTATYLIPAGTTDVGIRIPLTDPGPAKLLIEHCSELAVFGGRAVAQDGVCHFGGRPTGTGAWIDGADLRIGDRRADAPVSIAPSPLAAELAQGSWSLALFSRGSYLRTALPGADTFSQMTGFGPLFPRMAPLTNELGVAIRRDGPALHFVLGARTAWSNPGDIVDKLLAITPADLASGKAAEIARAIADAAPRSPFADDLRAGDYGFRTMQLPLGVAGGTLVRRLVDQLMVPAPGPGAP